MRRLQCCQSPQRSSSPGSVIAAAPIIHRMADANSGMDTACQMCGAQAPTTDCRCGGGALYLCVQCFALHQARFPQLNHEAIPIDVQAETFQRFLERSRNFAVGKKELERNVEKIDRCCDEMSLAVNSLIAQLIWYRETTAAQLAGEKATLQSEIAQAISEVQSSLGQDEVQLPGKFAGSLRNYRDGELTVFAYQVTGEAVERSLSTITNWQVGEQKETTAEEPDSKPIEEEEIVEEMKLVEERTEIEVAQAPDDYLEEAQPVEQPVAKEPTDEEPLEGQPAAEKQPEAVPEKPETAEDGTATKGRSEVLTGEGTATEVQPEEKKEEEKVEEQPEEKKEEEKAEEQPEEKKEEETAEEQPEEKPEEAKVEEPEEKPEEPIKEEKVEEQPEEKEEAVEEEAEEEEEEAEEEEEEEEAEEEAEEEVLEEEAEEEVLVEEAEEEYPPVLPLITGNRMRRYDMYTGEVTVATLTTSFLTGAMYCLIDENTALCVGGSKPANPNVFLLKIAESKLLPVAPMKTARNLPGIIKYDTEVYVFGGLGIGPLTQCERYSIAPKRWTALGSMAKARLRFCPVVHSEEIYLACVRAESAGLMEIFNIASEEFRPSPVPVPSGGVHSIAFAMGNEMIVLAGSGHMYRWRFNAERTFRVEPKAPGTVYTTNLPPVVYGREVWWIQFSNGDLCRFDFEGQNIEVVKTK